MMQLEEIEEAIVALPKSKLQKLREWFTVYDADQWDSQIERDALSGRLDSLMDEAIEEFKADKCTPL